MTTLAVFTLDKIKLDKLCDGYRPDNLSQARGRVHTTVSDEFSVSNGLILL